MQFVFEIPTGVVADYFGRKFSVLFGVLVCAVGNFVYYASDHLPGFLLAEAIFALGMSFMSGALEAWVNDELDNSQSKEKMSSVFSKGEIAVRIGAMVGGFVGGWISLYNLDLPWLLSGIGGLCVFLVFWKLMKEEYFRKSEHRGFRESLRKMREICVDSVKYGYANKKVWNLILLNMLYVSGTQSYNFLWAPFFEKTIGQWFLGNMFLLFMGATIAGCLLVVFLTKKKIGELRIMAVSLIIAGLCGGLIYLFKNPVILVCLFLLHEFGRGIFMPVQKALVQAEIPSDKRATIGSFSAMCGKVGAAVGWMSAGVAGDYWQIPTIWLISSFVFFLCLLFVRKLRATSA